MKNKRIILLSAIIAVAALLTIGTVVTATNSTVVVTPTNLNGWTEQHANCNGGSDRKSVV